MVRLFDPAIVNKTMTTVPINLSLEAFLQLRETQPISGW